MKIDGWRGIAFVDDRRVLLQSRAGRALERLFPDVVADLAATVPAGTVLDGEIAIFDPVRGRTWFPWLSRRVTAGRLLAREARTHPAAYIAFDVLQLSGVELVDRPLAQRRAALEELAVRSAGLAVCPQTADRREALDWMTVGAPMGVEGLVIKALGDRYAPSARWRKYKTRGSVEAIAAGAIGPINAPTGLLLGRVDRTGLLTYVGRAHVPQVWRAELGALLPALAWRGPGHPWPQPLPATWAGVYGSRTPIDYLPLEPVVVVEVDADTAVDGGRLRHVSTLRKLRLDQSADEVPSIPAR